MSKNPRYSVGQYVLSYNSGLLYIIDAVHELDRCGSYAYSVRRWRAGVRYGPTKRIAEVGLVPSEFQAENFRDKLLTSV